MLNNSVRRTICICLCLLITTSSLSQSSKNQKSFLVCGDSKVLLVDYKKSSDSVPEVVWSWDAHQAKDLPEEYRQKKFNSLDDCKSVNKGKHVLVSSSSGAIALLNRGDGKVLFFAGVPNAHSIEVLPGNLVVAAASTSADGNKIMLFDIQHPDKVLFTDSLYSAHGLVWDEKRKSLFALGYDVLREYKIASGNSLSLKAKWKFPGSAAMTFSHRRMEVHYLLPNTMDVGYSIWRNIPSAK